MKARWIIVATLHAFFSGCATVNHSQYIYFPSLAEKVLAGDAQAFRRILVEAKTTPPGARLEELAEISSRFVRIAPKEFLMGQAATTHCFRVTFLGQEYVDNSEASNRELTLRREALESVADDSLQIARERCLAVLARR